MVFFVVLLIDLEINIAFMFRIYTRIVCAGALHSSISKAKQEKEDASEPLTILGKNGSDSALRRRHGALIKVRGRLAAYVSLRQKFGSVFVSQMQL